MDSFKWASTSVAIKGQRRISEAQLIAPALFSGIVGILLGMLTFHHKTAKPTFQIKLALAAIMFACAAYYFTQMV